ncbi:MAG TPA: hypothetical protein VFY93_15920 [Planctomycetota bacterium]|nr:hypothetical protein [Planctomycetota bacterium]
MCRTCLIPLLIVAASATADELHLKDGRVLSGRVLEDGDRYAVVDRDGKYVVRKSEVTELVKKKSFMDDFDDRLASLPADDAEAIFEFGRWLEENDWASRAKLAYAEVLDLDPDHRGARRALGYSLYEGAWVSPDELNRRKGLVEFEGRWYTKHDLEELKRQIEGDEKLRKSYDERRRINDNINKIMRRFATLDKKQRQGAYDDLVRYAEDLNSPEVRKLADDSKAWYDEQARVICASYLARTEIHAVHTKLKQPIESFTTNLGAAIALGAAQNPVTIQLPELKIAEVHTTVDIPVGCR